MNKFNLALVLAVGLTACGREETPMATTEVLPTLNVETAQLQAETYIKNLFPETQVNGPVCMPEAVVDQYTQCSYSMRSGESWQVGTLLCSNLGCREGEAPTVVAADVAPQAQASAGGGGGMDNDWLFYYMLLNSGAVHGPYSVWYSSTPVIYRSAYYGVGYHPSVESRTYYTRTYAAPIRTSSTQRFSTVTAGRPGVSRTPVPSTSRSTTPSTSRSTTPSTSRSTPTTSTPRATPAPRVAPAPRPAPSRSSGFRAPTRSGRR